MYKKEEKKLHFLLDKLMLMYADSEKNAGYISYLNGKILDMLQARSILKKLKN